MSFFSIFLVIGIALISLKSVGDKGGDSTDFFTAFFSIVFVFGMPLVMLVAWLV